MLTINNNSLVSGYIKQMLHEFNLPKAKVLTIGMHVFKGGYYIVHDKLYRALVTGVYSSYNDVKDKTLFYEIGNYMYGKSYLNITKNLELNNSLYDKYVHYYLGDFLRFYRDFKGIDLMSMYNCFGGEVAQNINLTLTKKTTGDTQQTIATFNTEDNSSAIFLVPVKFYKEYTIAIDCSTAVEMAVCFYSNKRLSIQTKSQDLIIKSFARYSGASFNTPFKYTKLKTILDEVDNPELLYSHEKDLYLMIKIPSTNKSSLVVLEGDFTHSNSTFSRDFSWEDYKKADGTYLLPQKDWYEFSGGTFVKVIDDNTQYYDSNNQQVSSFVPGAYYHEQGKTPFALSLSQSYYIFDNTIWKVGYSVYNAERPVSYFLFRDNFPAKPSSKMINNIFVDEDTNKSYIWDTESETYTELNANIDAPAIYKRPYSSKMQLLYVNDKNSYVFADKLIGYIIRNVITSDDNIADNIRRLQKTYYYRSNPSRRPDSKKSGREPIGYDVPPKHWGLWSQDLRDMTYDLMERTGTLNTAFDVIGYVDKDAEKVLGKDLSYDTEGHVISGGIPE